jgi:hypothetical protein
MSTAKQPEVVTVPEEGFFAIVKWDNPYCGSDEYSWTGPFTTRKGASEAGKRVYNRGPRTFIDWVKSARPVSVVKGVKAFVAKAKKVGLNPNVSELDLRD